MRTRPWLSWLLALFLLWGQAAAFAHALDHVDENVADAPCELCVGQAQLGGNAPPAAALVFAVAVAHPAPVVASFPFVSFTARAACARGPPATLFV